MSHEPTGVNRGLRVATGTLCMSGGARTGQSPRGPIQSIVEDRDPRRRPCREPPRHNESRRTLSKRRSRYRSARSPAPRHMAGIAFNARELANARSARFTVAKSLGRRVRSRCLRARAARSSGDASCDVVTTAACSMNARTVWLPGAVVSTVARLLVSRESTIGDRE